MTRARLLFLILYAAAPAAGDYRAPYAPVPPAIDGVPDDVAWASAEWRDLRFPIIGEMPDEDDFSGRYKVVWSDTHLFLLAEIRDDRLVDSTANPLERYWDDDALEIFIDEDASGGLHQFDYSAFAYHISLANHAVDIGPYRSMSDEAAGRMNVRTFPDHIQSQWRRDSSAPHPLTWEVRIAVVDDGYSDPELTANHQVRLLDGKQLGFMLAYCDSDSVQGREHFVGDVEIEPRNGDRNLGYIDASVFGVLTLYKNNSGD